MAGETFSVYQGWGLVPGFEPEPNDYDLATKTVGVLRPASRRRRTASRVGSSAVGTTEVAAKELNSWW